MGIVRIWLLGSVAALLLALVWAFVPILIPMAAVAGGLGVLAAGMIAVARAIERRRPATMAPDQDEGKPPV